jgi:energy-coupling factor transport system ATP-binding protein
MGGAGAGTGGPGAGISGPGAGISARDWGYRHPGRGKPALADVTFDVAAGELVVLMGASGSGKSTLLGALAGVLPPEGATGALVVAGGSPAAQVAAPAVPGRPDQELAPGGSAGGAQPVGQVQQEPEARPVGLVQQEPEGNIVMELVGDDVAFPLEGAAVPADRIWPRVAAALAAVGLDVALDRPTAHLSGGQQQQLAIAAATVAAPGLLLLDEPTANLDPASARAVLAAVDAVRTATGCTVVVVEHRVEPWLARADRVLLAAAGSVRALAPGEVREHLARNPDLAARVWIDHDHLPDRSPAAPADDVVLVATGVAVEGRLPAVDLVVRSGEVVALTGPPGSGKSTLLACLAGLLEPTSGTVRVRAGQERVDPWRWPARDIAATFGVVFQNPEHQFVTGRVVDELHHGLTGAGVADSEAAARARVMLERLHLADLGQANPFTLSGGEQRRLSVGTALVLDPRVLLLDEPTFGQDPATWAEVVDIIAAHRDAGGAVVLATHDPDLVRCLAAREVRLGGRPRGTSRPVGGPGPVGEGAPAVGAAPVGEVAALPAPDVGARRVGANPGGGPLAPSAAGALPGRAAHGLRALDPLALVGAAALASGAALVSGSVGLNLALAAAAALAALLGGLPSRRVALLAVPALVAAAGVAFSNALLSEAGITSAPAWASAALPASRVLAVALPGLVTAVALDPTALADALVVRARVPARAAYSALAGLRLLPLLADEWTTLGAASRARGLGGTGLRTRAGQFGSMTFRLLVAALRRGGRLAIALDARGLRADAPRTVARPVRWGRSDTAAVLVGLAALSVGLVTRL